MKCGLPWKPLVYINIFSWLDMHMKKGSSQSMKVQNWRNKQHLPDSGPFNDQSQVSKKSTPFFYNHHLWRNKPWIFCCPIHKTFELESPSRMKYFHIRSMPNQGPRLHQILECIHFEFKCFPKISSKRSINCHIPWWILLSILATTCHKVVRTSISE